ncbi:unnamed protein product [Prorocentrum cordatum]|uniref:Uncharacterized protein n=1 Tax=Prorocentrum cordatum TaxID=2364126 RepID=A0ABN9PZK3_9DINO|nr:unnamed protein product [Polarella glacialis]
MLIIMPRIWLPDGSQDCFEARARAAAVLGVGRLPSQGAQELERGAERGAKPPACWGPPRPAVLTGSARCAPAFSQAARAEGNMGPRRPQGLVADAAEQGWQGHRAAARPTTEEEGEHGPTGPDRGGRAKFR